MKPRQLNFFGTKFKHTLWFILLAELASFFVIWTKIAFDLSLFFYLIIFVLVFGLSLYKLKWGIYTALVELIIGSQGHLFSIDIADFQVSIRIGIFSAIMLAWLIKSVWQKTLIKEIKQVFQIKHLTILAIVLTWGIIQAFWQNNGLKNIFLDFNAWLYFLYIFPFVSVYTNNKFFSDFWPIFSAGLVAISLKTMIFLFIFAHKFPIMGFLYTWGRDTLWGEFTLLNSGFFRIFSQAQIFALIGFFIFWTYFSLKNKFNLKSKQNICLLIMIILLGSTILTSLSRSFWVGLIGGIIVYFLTLIFYYRKNLRQTALLFMTLLLIGVVSYGLVSAIINIPLPFYQSSTEKGSMIKDRFSVSDEAVSSRWSQLPELGRAISKHPIVGSGWGRSITYKSQDPRILTKDNPQGWYTTYAFEWGYLDILLKIGLFGLLVYLVFIWQIIRKIYDSAKKKQSLEKTLLIGSLLGLLSLLLVNGFTPYLNHPLGIGYLLILIIILLDVQPNTEPIKS